MIHKQPTVFEKDFNNQPKSLIIKAIFVYLFARDNHEPPDSQYLINLNNCEELLDLLGQLYDLPISEISNEDFKNQELHNHLFNILTEWNLLLVKEKLISACKRLYSELGEWLYELLELKGETDDCLYAPKLNEKWKHFHNISMNIKDYGLIMN